MTDAKALRANQHRATQMLVALCLVVFFSIIAFGYFNIFANSGAFPATIIGFVMAALACVLARVAGTWDGGVARMWPLILVLFVISGFSVYTSLMLLLEGGQIVSDSITQSQEQLEQLEQLEGIADRTLADKGAAARINRINSLRDSLVSEIQNPVNCGQGPEAVRLIAELRRELPGFTPLSMPGRNCAKNAEVVSDYQQRIGDLILRDPRNYGGLLIVRQDSIDLRGKLEKLREDATVNYSPLRIPGIVQALETHDTEYRAARYRASKDASVEALPSSLPIETVRSLGNAARLPTLIISRLGHPATLVYLLFALGADLFVVFAFRLAKNARPDSRRQATAELGRAF